MKGSDMRAQRTFFAWFTFIVFLAVLAFWCGISNKYVVPIVMYHHVGYSQKPDKNTVSPEIFESQMTFLKKNKYRVISLEELVTAIKENRHFPQKSVVITFDDGYEDNYIHAFPILKKYGFSATIFVITDIIGTPGQLTLGQMNEMLSSGMEMASHTQGHPYLPEQSSERQKKEIFGSKRVLQESLGIPVRHISYPSGGFNEQIKTFVKEAGYEGACTTNRGFARLNEDEYELKRIRLNNQDNKELFLWFKLSGYYNFFRKSVNPE